jgi:hypothetical protein
MCLYSDSAETAHRRLCVMLLSTSWLTAVLVIAHAVFAVMSLELVFKSFCHY